MKETFSRWDCQHLLEKVDKDLCLSGAQAVEPIYLDASIANSLWQKAIRRGDVELAQRSAAKCFLEYGPSMWSRMCVIAFEDVGIANPGLLCEITAVATSPRWREKAEGDIPLACLLTRRMAESPKDRSSDYLICAAHDHPKSNRIRQWVKSLSVSERIERLLDDKYSLLTRSILAWYSSGIEWGDEKEVGSGDIDRLLDVYLDAGVPVDLLQATKTAALVAREPITIMIPALWREAQYELDDRTHDSHVPVPSRVSGIPMYALDMHTELGRQAVAHWANTNEHVNSCLTSCVKGDDIVPAALLGAFYSDGAPVARRFGWSQSSALEFLGVESDLLTAGVDKGSVHIALRTLQDNLDELNEIRAKLYLAQREDADVNKHSVQTCFREPIAAFSEAMELLDRAASAHMNGDRTLAAKLIKQADIPELKDWTESIWGSGSPYVHYRDIEGAPPHIPKKDRVNLRMPNAAEKRALLDRDGYHCRFCGLPVIRPEVRKELQKHYSEELRWGGTNATQHGAFEAMWVQYDHIVPHSRGGNNDLNNLVITCAPCNFGRMSYLLEEVGLTDPFEREPIKSDWDGLERVLNKK